MTMKDLSITQEYMMLAVNEKGVLSAYNQKAIACLIVGGLAEMQMEGCIAMENKKIAVCAELPERISYLKPLYDIINRGKPVKPEKIMEAYTASFTNKNLNELLNAIVNELKAAGAVEPVKTGILGSKESYAPKKAVITGIVEKIRAELLEDGEISEEVIALTALLDKAGQLKDYFSKYEQKELKEKISQIRNSDAAKTAKETIQHIDALAASVIAFTVIASNV